MKIFESSSKVNFVDENNVFVGFNLNQQCFEDAGWVISADETNRMPENNQCRNNYDNYVFDTNYYYEVENKGIFREGAMIRFRLVSEYEHDLYLYIYNCHNGYYSHGFTASINGVFWKSGEL